MSASTEIVRLSFPWVAALIGLPALGALILTRLDEASGRRVGIAFALAALGLSLGAYAALPEQGPAFDPSDPFVALGGSPVFVIDELSAPLLPFGALLFAVVALALPRVRPVPGQLARLLVAETVTLATFASIDDVVLGVLWLAGIVLLEQELRRATAGSMRGVRAYLWSSVLLLGAGLAARRFPGSPPELSSGLLLLSVLIRKGIVPLHSWMPVLFARAPLPAAVLFTMPQVGTYVAARWIAPSAPGSVLAVLGAASLFTAVYAAGIALVQSDGRRAVGWLFMSQSALVLAGLECTSAVGLGGGLCLWISSSLALAGLAMTMAVLQARRGHVSLARHAGGYQNTPMLATTFVLLGLCSVGFPGTLGFVGAELLIDGSVEAHPHVGVATVVAGVLNGISVVRMFFLLFCGARAPERPELRLRSREHAAFLLLVGVLVVGGVQPQPFVLGRGRAAAQTMELRTFSP